MRTRYPRGATVAIIVTAALAGGCAYTPLPVRWSDPYRSDSAYIYGQFRMMTDEHMAAAFSIQCRDGKRYKIVFSKDQQVQMIRLRAGVCQLEDVIYAGWRSARDQASLRLLGNEHLAPGGVYYVGDFIITASTRAPDPDADSDPGRHRRPYQHWELLNPVDNYASTTVAMKRMFPSFAAVATEDRMPRQ